MLAPTHPTPGPPARLQTALYGKNHLGCPGNTSYSPRGWSEFGGTCDVHFKFGPASGLPELAVMANGSMLGRLYDTPEFAIDTAAHTGNLTQTYTAWAVDFVARHAAAGTPFFLFFVPDSTHGPVFSAPRFTNTSRRGPYGDALTEVDDSIGRILDQLAASGVADNTLVFLSSDNGAATYDFGPAGPNGGSNGMLLCGKETTFEGGQREPTVAVWSGVIPSGTVTHEVVTLMDVFTTALTLAGVPVPADRVVDGVDMMPVLTGGVSSVPAVYYYRGNGLFAVRQGRWKAHLWTWDNTVDATGPDNHPGDAAEFCPGQITPNVTTRDMRNRTAAPLLFDLWADPGERYPVPPTDHRYAAVMASIADVVAAHEAALVPGTPQLDWCDDATGNWAPPGCEALGLCQPVPPSNRTRCLWTH
jgi:N-acetylgalactosamine-6-sulfatase